MRERSSAARTVAGTALTALRRNGLSLLLFELAYKFLFSAVMDGAQDLLALAMERCGLSYLTPATAVTLLRDPLSVALILLFICLLFYSVLVEITALILCCQRSLQGERVGPFALLRAALARATRLLRPRNAPLLFLLLVLVPVVAPTFTSTALHNFQIPSFILDFIRGRTALYLLYLGLLALLCWLLLRWLLVLPEMVLTGRSFREARIRSCALLAGRKGRVLGAGLLWGAAVLLLAGLCYLGSTLVLLGGVKLLHQGSLSTFWYQFLRLDASLRTLFAIGGAACSSALVTALRTRLLGEVPAPPPPPRRRRLPRAAGALALGYLLLIFHVESTVNLWRDPLAPAPVQVVAHRAGALYAPENTLAALDQAIESGANAAEIDVQQTADGALIVLHDTNFKWVAGVDRNTWEVTLEEVRSYDAGSAFSEDFAGEGVPTLEEMLQRADGKIGLMIELKSTGHERGLERAAVDLLRQYDAFKSCTIASMDYSILERVKAYDERVQTVYILPAAYGDLAEMTAADAFSVEATFVTGMLSATLQYAQKPLYAWTVNDSGEIDRLLDLEISGVITDDPYLARYTIAAGGRSWWVSALAERFLDGG